MDIILYATVYNNSIKVLDSLNSIIKLNPKKIVIVDNFSNDGTFEKIQNYIQENNYPILLLRFHCSRGKGRQIAMENALKFAKDEDLLMMFDLDDIYTNKFIKLIEKLKNNFDEKDVHINFLSKKRANEKIPWRDLNMGEYWERIAHFYALGYNVYIYANDELIISDINEIKDNRREKRYAKGLKYYVRIFKNEIDLFRGWGINNHIKFKQYMEFIKPKVSRRKFIILKIILPVFYLYVKYFKECYSYSNFNINKLITNENKKVFVVHNVFIEEIKK